MFEPQGGSLHTDENMTMHVHSIYCMTPGLEDTWKACIKDFTQRSKRTVLGYIQTLYELKKFTRNPDIVSDHSIRLIVHKPPHTFFKIYI